MPALISRPIIALPADPPPAQRAALVEEQKLKNKCGAAAANLAGRFEREASPLPPPPAQPQPPQRRAAATASGAGKAAAGAGARLAANRALHRAGEGGAVVAVPASPLPAPSPRGPPGASDSPDEVGPTPLLERGGGAAGFRARLGTAGGDAVEGGAEDVTRGLFGNADDANAGAGECINRAEAICTRDVELG